MNTLTGELEPWPERGAVRRRASWSLLECAHYGTRANVRDRLILCAVYEKPRRSVKAVER